MTRSQSSTAALRGSIPGTCQALCKGMWPWSPKGTRQRGMRAQGGPWCQSKSPVTAECPAAALQWALQDKVLGSTAGASLDPRADAALGLPLAGRSWDAVPHSCADPEPGHHEQKEPDPLVPDPYPGSRPEAQWGIHPPASPGSSQCSQAGPASPPAPQAQLHSILPSRNRARKEPAGRTSPLPGGDHGQK